MQVHNKGRKSVRDRTILIHSYNVMCSVFKVPRTARLSAKDLAAMSTTTIYQLTQDLYNGQPIENVRKLTKLLHLEPFRIKPTFFERLGAILTRIRITKVAKHA